MDYQISNSIPAIEYRHRNSRCNTQYYIQWIPKQRNLAALSFKLVSENKLGQYSQMIVVEMRNHGKEWKMSHW